MGRAPCCDKANVKRGPWSPEEDSILKSYIHKFGTGGNWIALPQKIGLKRCGKSCRLRWLNYLRPNIKHGGFTHEEDNIICSLYISIGSRWSIIANQLPGRTDNDIKNYWNTKLKKKLLGRRPGNRFVPAGLQQDSDLDLQNLSNAALERLQLHLHLLTYNNNPSFVPLDPLGHTDSSGRLCSPQPAAAVGLKDQNDLVNVAASSPLETSTSWLPMKTESDDIMGAEIDLLLQSNNYMRSDDQTADIDCLKSNADVEGSMDQINQQQQEVAWWCNEDYSATTYIC